MSFIFASGVLVEHLPYLVDGDLIAEDPLVGYGPGGSVLIGMGVDPEPSPVHEFLIRDVAAVKHAVASQDFQDIACGYAGNAYDLSDIEQIF